MAKNKTAKQASGGARLVAAGRKPMSLGWLPEDHAAIAAAAREERLPMTAFVIRASLDAARKILSRRVESP